MRGPSNQTDLPPVALMWENIGPMHHDRLRALSRAGFEVDVIEQYATSQTYQWEREEAVGYRVHTLSENARTISGAGMFWRMLRACLRTRAKHFFLCHYQYLSTLAVAAVLRLLGRRVYTMADSKFDDFPRRLWREVGKSFYFLPYSGAIVASRRSRDYLRLLGVPGEAIALGYDTIDTARPRALAGEPAPGQPFETRPFLVVARLVPKKNIPFILAAFAQYRARFGDRRELHLIGYGPLEADLTAEAARLELGNAARFLGLRQAGEVAQAMQGALALILASTEEQFGLVVNEALSVGLPVIVSSQAGAVDVLVENLGNGIVIDPYDTETLVLAMAHLASDEARWKAMSARALETSPRADVGAFCEPVRQLVLHGRAA